MLRTARLAGQPCVRLLRLPARVKISAAAPLRPDWSVLALRRRCGCSYLMAQPTVRSRVPAEHRAWRTLTRAWIGRESGTRCIPSVLGPVLYVTVMATLDDGRKVFKVGVTQTGKSTTASTRARDGPAVKNLCVPAMPAFAHAHTAFSL